MGSSTENGQTPNRVKMKVDYGKIICAVVKSYTVFHRHIGTSFNAARSFNTWAQAAIIAAHKTFALVGLLAFSALATPFFRGLTVLHAAISIQKRVIFLEILQPRLHVPLELTRADALTIRDSGTVVKREFVHRQLC